MTKRITNSVSTFICSFPFLFHHIPSYISYSITFLRFFYKLSPSYFSPPVLIFFHHIIHLLRFTFLSNFLYFPPSNLPLYSSYSCIIFVPLITILLHHISLPSVPVFYLNIISPLFSFFNVLILSTAPFGSESDNTYDMK